MSYNRAIIIGRLTKAPERKATTSGKSVCNFVVAVDRGYKDQNGDTQTDFLSVVVWGKTAVVSGLCKWLCTKCGHFVVSDKNNMVCGNCGAKAEEAAHPKYGIRGLREQAGAEK